MNSPLGTLGLLQPVALGLRIDTVEVGINYRWGGPIVARYRISGPSAVEIGIVQAE